MTDFADYWTEQLDSIEHTDLVVAQLMAALADRGLLERDVDVQVERARGWALEMMRRVDLAEQLVTGRDSLDEDGLAELAEILRGDR